MTLFFHESMIAISFLIFLLAFGALYKADKPLPPKDSKKNHFFLQFNTLSICRILIHIRYFPPYPIFVIAIQTLIIDPDLFETEKKNIILFIMIGMMNSAQMCKQVRWPNLLQLRNFLQKDKVVVVMGVTGAGKSKLSIDLATQFNGEIINSDKIQVYKGLDIATNKITEEERCGVPHHCLGVIDPYKEFTTKNFCNMASFTVNSITNRGKLPIIVGGSNSFIEAFVHNNNSYNFSTRYDFCFLWVDASMNVLNSFLYERVDKMVDQGMVDEVRQMFNSKNMDYTKGIRKAIGVPEFDSYFRAELSNSVDKQTRERMLKEAITEVKINNCILASKQLDKIKRLINVKGWKIHRLDATEVYKKQRIAEEKEAEEIWKNMVMGQSRKIVHKFLYENYRNSMVYKSDGTAIMAAASQY